MRDGFVKIHHTELNVESAVPKHTVPHWQSRGWKSGALPGPKPTSTTPTTEKKEG